MILVKQIILDKLNFIVFWLFALLITICLLLYKAIKGCLIGVKIIIRKLFPFIAYLIIGLFNLLKIIPNFIYEVVQRILFICTSIISFCFITFLKVIINLYKNIIYVIKFLFSLFPNNYLASIIKEYIGLFTKLFEHHYKKFTFKKFKNKYINFKFYYRMGLGIISFITYLLVYPLKQTLDFSKYISNSTIFDNSMNIIKSCSNYSVKLFLYINKPLIGLVKIAFITKVFVKIYIFARNIVIVIFDFICLILSFTIGIFTFLFLRQIFHKMRKNLKKDIIKKLLAFIKFEGKYIMGLALSICKNIALFLYKDVLNIIISSFSKQNAIKTCSLLTSTAILIYSSVYFYRNNQDYLIFSEKWNKSLQIMNSSHLFVKIIKSELFQPVIYYKEDIKLMEGETLYAMFYRRGIEKENVNDVMIALTKHINLKKINPKLTLKVVFASSSDWGEDKIKKLSLPLSIKEDLIVEADVDYNYVVYKQEKKLTRYILRRKVLVKDSIYTAAINAGVPASIAVEVFKVLSWDIDFQRDIKEHNTMEVIFECMYNQEDELVSCDNLMFATIKLEDRVVSFYKYSDGYYHEDGKSVIKTLIKTPVNNARLSSRFGNRVHPVLGYTALHKGVDFAAPIGTPIYASGSGVIEKKLYSATYGNYVVIRHNPYLKSLYAHMNSFAPKLKEGDRVSQWQVIGTIGATGRVTGPHLHYEVLLNNRQVNPLTIKMPSDKVLNENEIKEFAIYKSTFNTLAVRIPTKNKIASPNISFDADKSNTKLIKSNKVQATIIYRKKVSKENKKI